MLTCEKCGRDAHRDDAMERRCNGCEHLVRECICKEDLMLTGLWRGKLAQFPYGPKRRRSKYFDEAVLMCTCGSEWCTTHNDCTWECWDFKAHNDKHMTVEEYNLYREHKRDEALNG